MSHYILKLSSGELVYGLIDAKKSDKQIVILENPLIWEEYEGADGTVATALVKYMNGTDEDVVPFATSHITSMVKMSKSFSDYYDAAVACNKITDEAYNERLKYMTSRIVDIVLDYQAKAMAAESGGIVATKTNTIH